MKASSEFSNLVDLVAFDLGGFSDVNRAFFGKVTTVITAKWGSKFSDLRDPISPPSSLRP